VEFNEAEGDTRARLCEAGNNDAGDCHDRRFLPSVLLASSHVENHPN
jgi:hypothetical protein